MRVTSQNNAVDGQDDTYSFTMTENSPWWIVDLQSEYIITHVAIRNYVQRGFSYSSFWNSCFNSDTDRSKVYKLRLNDWTIANLYFTPGPKIVAVGNNFTSCDSFNPHDFPHSKRVTSSEILSFDTPVRGRYVTVYLPGSGHLALSKVEVYGLLASGNTPCLFITSL